MNNLYLKFRMTRKEMNIGTEFDLHGGGGGGNRSSNIAENISMDMKSIW